jgi:electron-transferring-flavoprotein dehydrogenase
MNEQNKMDVLFVGAGPASLAGAIKLKQLLNQKGRTESVVVIEKAEKLGQHSLSGAVFEADVLSEIVPDWKDRKDAFVTKTLGNKVEKDEVLFLSKGSARKLPDSIIPAAMHHKGDFVLSLSEMVNWLAEIARGLGVEIYTGFAARELVADNTGVKGIKLGERGLDKERQKLANYLPGETLEAKVTVIGGGSLSQLAEDAAKKFGLAKGKNPQVYSLGVKEIIRLPEKNNFGTNRVIHTMGFPQSDIFGGGTIYSMGGNLVAVALVLGLDWKYCDLNPQQELQVFKSHPRIKPLLEGGEVIAYGAKTLPEGGYYSLPELATNGAVIIGDAAGFTSVRKLKGLHYAIKSGIAAAEGIFEAIEKGDFSASGLKGYPERIEQSFIMKDLRAGRNYRQAFARGGGVFMGTPLSLIQGAFARMKTEPDYEGMRRSKLDRQPTGTDRLTDVSLSGTTHREDEPSHITITDTSEHDRCFKAFGCHPCEFFCPAEVYRFEGDNLILSPSNCVPCQTCRIKCPRQAIKWEVPEGGDGPKYKIM